MISMKRRERLALEALRSIGGKRAFGLVFAQVVDMARDQSRSASERSVWAAIEDAIALDLEKK